jgi:hypothetical protein
MKFKIESLIKSSLTLYARSVHVATKSLAHLVAACMLFFVQTSSWSQTTQVNDQVVMQKNINNDSTTNSEILSQIDSVNNIVEATVIIDPPDVDHNRKLSQEEFVKFECAYTTRDVGRIADLVKIVKHSNIKIDLAAARSMPQESWELREGVFLKNLSGGEAKFLFDRAYNNMDATQGSFDEHSILASRSLPKKIYQWVARLGKSTECKSFESYQCKLVCEPFIKEFRKK